MSFPNALRGLRFTHRRRRDVGPIRHCETAFDQLGNVTVDPQPQAALVLADGARLRDATRLFQCELILTRLEKYDGRKAARESLGLTKTTFLRYLRGRGIVAEVAEDEG